MSDCTYRTQCCLSQFQRWGEWNVIRSGFVSIVFWNPSVILVCVMKNDAFLNGEVGKQQKLCRCRKIKLKKPTLRGNNKTTELAVFKMPFFFPCSICFIFCGIFPKPISLSRGKSPTCKHFSDLLSWFKKKISLSYMFPLQTEDIGWALLWELNITFVAVALLLSWTVSKICSLIL